MGDAYEAMEMMRQKTWREIADELRRANARLSRDARICAQAVLEISDDLDGIADEMSQADLRRVDGLASAVAAARRVLEVDR